MHELEKQHLHPRISRTQYCESFAQPSPLSSYPLFPFHSPKFHFTHFVHIAYYFFAKNRYQFAIFHFRYGKFVSTTPINLNSHLPPPPLKIEHSPSYFSVMHYSHTHIHTHKPQRDISTRFVKCINLIF